MTKWCPWPPGARSFEGSLASGTGRPRRNVHLAQAVGFLESLGFLELDALKGETDLQKVGAFGLFPLAHQSRVSTSEIKVREATVRQHIQ